MKPLPCPKIGTRVHRVGKGQGNQCQIWWWWQTQHGGCTNNNASLSTPDVGEVAFEVAVETINFRLRQKNPQLALDPLAAGSAWRKHRPFATGATGWRRGAVAALVALEDSRSGVVFERHIAVWAVRNPSAIFAAQHGAVASAWGNDHSLAAAFGGLAQHAL